MFIDEKTTPFENDNSIFQDTRLGLDDNRYFMHVRAAFGAHPVNLLEGRKRNGTETVRYASWPTSGIYPEYDYAVLLYSGCKDSDYVPFGFKVNQLTDFFESRYKYLEEIEKAIDKMVEAHCSKKKAIEIVRVIDPIEQLQILQKENNERLNNEHYDYIINSLTIFFQTEFTAVQNVKIIKKFKDIMYQGISDMDVSELNVDIYLNPEYPRAQHFGYAFGKLSDHILGNSDKPLIMLQEIIEPLKDYVVFDYQTIEELYWLTIMALNIKNGNL